MDKVIATRKRFYAKNRDRVLAEVKAYNKEHKEIKKQYLREYYAKNTEQFAVYGRKRRALKFANGHEAYTTQQVLDTYGTDCHICLEPIDLDAPRKQGEPGWEKGLHLDHVLPLKLGGPDKLANVKPAHGECNIRKNAREMVTE